MGKQKQQKTIIISNPKLKQFLPEKYEEKYCVINHFGEIKDEKWCDELKTILNQLEELPENVVILLDSIESEQINKLLTNNWIKSSNLLILDSIGINEFKESSAKFNQIVIRTSSNQVESNLSSAVLSNNLIIYFDDDNTEKQQIREMIRFKLDYFYQKVNDKLVRENKLQNDIVLNENQITFIRTMPSLIEKTNDMFTCELVLKNSETKISIVPKLQWENSNWQLNSNLTKIVTALEEAQYTLLLKVYLNGRCFTYWYDQDLLCANKTIKLIPAVKEYKVKSQSNQFLNLGLYGYTDQLKGHLVLENNQKIRFGTYRNRYTKLMNIDNRDIKEIIYDSRMQCKIVYADTMLLNSEQKKYNQKNGVICESGINYAFKTNNQAKKLLVTFPGFNTSSNVSYPVVKLSSYQEQLTDFAILSFQDFSLVAGSYLMYDQNKNLADFKIVEIINQKLKQLNLKENNLVMYGNSKGGTIALRFSKYFSEAIVIADGPQIDVQKKGFNPIIKYHNDQKILEENNFISYLNQNNKNIFLGYSESDIDSTCGIINEKLGVNRRVYHDLNHSETIHKLLPLSVDIMINSQKQQQNYELIKIKELQKKLKDYDVYLQLNNHEIFFVNKEEKIIENMDYLVVEGKKVIRYRTKLQKFRSKIKAYIKNNVN